MIPLSASAEPAANAGTGPEGHKRSSSVDSGASSDTTMVASDIDWIDDADLGVVDGRHKSVAMDKALTSPPERSPKRAAGVHDPEAHYAQRGRVSTDTASGAPALATTTNTAGSSTAAAPITVSSYTATALAVADPNVNALNEPDEASNRGDHTIATAHGAHVAEARDGAAPAASSAGQDGVIAPGTPAPASGAIVSHHDFAPASASSSTGAASALGAAASKSDTIVANETSRGDAGWPETPVISRLPAPRSHVVAPADPVAVVVPISAFVIGRRSSPTSTPTPAPEAGGSRSAVIVANASSRVHAQCPSTPVVSRLPVLRSHASAGAAVSGSQFSAFSIGLPCSATSATAPTPATALAAPPAPAIPPMPTTALGHFGRAGSYAPPQNSPARIGALRAISRVVQRGMAVIRNALVALFKGDVKSTNGRRLTSQGSRDEGGCWDGDAPIDAVMLGLRKQERRRFL